MQQQPAQPRRYNRLSLAIFVAAGLLCLANSASASPKCSCTFAQQGVNPEGCDSGQRQELLVLTGALLRVDPEIAGTWAFILPGARAFSRVALPASLHLDATVEVGRDLIPAAVPVFRVAPKNSPPIA